MTISNIEVSLLPCESALSKYAIKHTTIIFEKRLILAWLVTYIYSVYIYLYMFLSDIMSIYIYIYVYIYIYIKHNTKCNT